MPLDPKRPGTWFLLTSLVALLGGLYWTFAPIQDRTSDAYRNWLAGRAVIEARQNEMKRILLADSFHYSRIELTHVGPGKAYYSWWGHVLLRFVGSGATPPEDLTLSFLADFNDFPVNKWKASFGGYSIFPKLGAYREFEAEYLLGENRYMRTMGIKSNEVNRRRLVEKLREWVGHPEAQGTYKFFTENCIGLLDRLLVESGVLGPNDFKRVPIFPWHLKDLLTKANLLEPGTE